MDIKVERKPKSKIKFHIKMTGDEVAHFFDMATERIAKELKISGFRPGKVPAEVAKGMIDEHTAEHEAQEIAINDSYFQMMSKENFIPLARPENVKINVFNKNEGLDWEGEVDILPEVKIDDWKKKIKSKSSKLKKNVVMVDEKEIDDTILGLQKQFANLEEKNDKTEKGDWINIDIDVVDKDRFAPEIAAKFLAKGFSLIIGEAGFIPGFEEELLGIKKEEEKEFDITFPENYHEKKLQKEKVKFKIKLNDIKKLVLPNLDGTFAKNFGFEKIEDLKSAVRKDIESRKEEMERARYEDEVLKEISDNAEMDIPDTLIEQEKDLIMQRFVHDLEHHKGIKFADYLGSLGKNEKEFRDGFNEHALKNVKTGLIIGQVAKNEKIEIGDSDIEEVMSMDIIKQTAGLPPERAKELEESIKEKYKNEEFLNSIKNTILARKTINLILNTVNKNKND